MKHQRRRTESERAASIAARLTAAEAVLETRERT